MELKRYTASDVAASRFYQMPKFLFEGELKNLSNDARVLYAMIKDRHELSLQNKWVNNRNEVFLVFKREKMQEALGLSENTVIKAVKQLKEYGLIEEERQGLGKPNKIYLLFSASYNDFSGTSKSAGQEPGDLHIRAVTSEYQEPKDLRPNDTNKNQTDFVDTDNQSIHLRSGREWVSSDGLSDEDLREEVDLELLHFGGIPYPYNTDERRMETAIKLKTDWYDLTPQYFETVFQYDTYDLAVDCLIDMACADDIRSYKGSSVSYAKVIDKINDIIKRDNSLFSVIEEAVDDYIKKANDDEIHDKRKYMMSVLWNSFLTYRVKHESLFARTFGR